MSAWGAPITHESSHGPAGRGLPSPPHERAGRLAAALEGGDPAQAPCTVAAQRRPK